MKQAILIISFMLTIGAVKGQQVQPQKALVVSFDSLHFFSNIFFIDELAYFNYVDPKMVVPIYRASINYGLKMEEDDLIEFTLADDSLTERIYKLINKIIIETPEDTFVGISGTARQADSLKYLLSKNDTHYLLSVNAFEIYAEEVPEEPQYFTPTEHQIHYDLFNDSLQLISQGKFKIKSKSVEEAYMRSKYREFGEYIAEKIFEDGNEGFESRNDAMFYMKDQNTRSTFGIGGSIGLSNYSGLGGIYGSYIDKNKTEYNMSLGYDFSGLMLAVGIKRELDYYINQSRIFMGANYGFNFRNTFLLGAVYDDFGEVINPDDVSEYRIFSNNTLYLSAGLKNIGETVSYLSFGYGVSLRNPKFELLSGPDEALRENFTRWMSPGGFLVSYTFVFHKNL